MFEGFSPETIDFLWGIRMNNSREWFEPHKKDYVKYLYEPMKALGKELFKPFTDKPGMILKVSRIYRDARLHYPVPYKEHLWLSIRPDSDQWLEKSCLFFQLSPEGADYGFGLWQPRAATADHFRKEWSARPEEFLRLLKDTEKAVGIPVTAGKTYKRPKTAPVPELQEYFSWRGDISCVRHLDPSEELFGPELENQVEDMFRALIPLYDYFNLLSSWEA